MYARDDLRETLAPRTGFPCSKVAHWLHADHEDWTAGGWPGTAGGTPAWVLRPRTGEHRALRSDFDRLGS